MSAAKRDFNLDAPNAANSGDLECNLVAFVAKHSVEVGICALNYCSSSPGHGFLSESEITPAHETLKASGYAEDSAGGGVFWNMGSV